MPVPGGAPRCAICFDGSPEATHALEFAISLGLPSTVVSVARPSKTPEKDQQRGKEMQEKADSALAAAIEKLGPRATTTKNNVTLLKSKDARGQLVEHVEEGKYDLCFVGNRGQGAFKRALLGSTSSTLLNTLQDTAVCVVREGGEVTAEPRKYLLAVDGSEPSLRAADLLNRMLRPEDTVHVLGVYELLDPIGIAAVDMGASSMCKVVQEMKEKEKASATVNVQEASTHLPGLVGEGRMTASVLEAGFSIPQTLVNYADENSLSGICMGSRGRGAVARTFLGSVTNHVLHESTLPLIVSH